MFDMLKIGKKIASLRKEKNMTQLELADRLGISYQAVSHWERGETMPDVSKLGELAHIFETTIDQLLDHQPLAKAVQEVIEEQKLNARQYDSKTLNDVIPLMKPKEIKSSVLDFEGDDPRLLLAFAPFLDEEEVDELAMKAYEKHHRIELVGLAPFMSNEGLKTIAIEIIKKDEVQTNMLPALAPFLDEDTVDLLATAIYQKNGATVLHPLLPFMSSDVIDHLIQLEVAKDNYDHIKSFLPFASHPFKKKDKDDTQKND